MLSFKTISKAVKNIFLREKGSKFIGFAIPASTESEIKAALENLRHLHPKATHHCYAYRLQANGGTHRANDDGEPSGSAGMPIYNQLLSYELQNVLLVVVRYYGGTKLGVSGLVKAYKECAKMTLETAEILIKEEEGEILLRFKFDMQNQVFTLLNRAGADIVHFETGNNCEILAKIKISQKKGIADSLSAMPEVSYEFRG